MILRDLSDVQYDAVVEDMANSMRDLVCIEATEKTKEALDRISHTRLFIGDTIKLDVNMSVEIAVDDIIHIGDTMQ